MIFKLRKVYDFWIMADASDFPRNADVTIKLFMKNINGDSKYSANWLYK